MQDPTTAAVSDLSFVEEAGMEYERSIVLP